MIGIKSMAVPNHHGKNPVITDNDRLMGDPIHFLHFFLASKASIILSLLGLVDFCATERAVSP